MSWTIGDYKDERDRILKENARLRERVAELEKDKAAEMPAKTIICHERFG